MQIKDVLRSYSFRSAALIFFAFSITLVAVRLTTYAQSLRTAYADIRLVVEAHVEDLGENIERYGPAYTGTVVQSLIRDSGDEDLYIGLQIPTGVIGNFPGLPPDARLAEGWTELSLAPAQGGNPLHLYAYVQRYPEGVALLVAYNLRHADEMKASLPETLFANVELALLPALVLSLLLVWLLNRHVRKFNKAFDRVSHGDLGYRMDVRSQTDQFDRLASNLNGMLDWLTTMLEMSRDLGNSLAHDLRTPLSRHRLELRAIGETPGLPEPIREQLASSVTRLDDLADMLDSILTISQAESRNPGELFEKVNLTELVLSMAEFYSPMVEDRQLALQTILPEEAICVTGDRQLLSQAILNLVDNAVKYTAPGGRVSLELRQDGAGVALAVADTGGGVSPEVLDKVKQRFYRADSSRHTPGSGLGLSLVEAVAKLHHGTLRVENIPGGFRATLTLGLPAQPG